MSKVCVLVTNHDRVMLLQRALDSCVRAGVRNVVVVSTGRDVTRKERKRVIDAFKKEFQSFKPIFFDSDPGNNTAWKIGLEMSEGEWTVILHDDDRLFPAFREVLELDLDWLKISSQVDFVCWDGILEGENWNKLHKFHPDLDGGAFKKASFLMPLLMKKDFLTLSPVSGLFEKKFLLEVLDEFKKNYMRFPELRVATNMWVGNDLLIWLMAAKKLRKFLYIAKAFNGFGCHPGSISFQDDLDRKNGKGRLFGIYNRTREIFESV